MFVLKVSVSSVYIEGHWGQGLCRASWRAPEVGAKSANEEREEEREVAEICRE